MEGRGGDDAENVIRLPRDWLGPPEELVPMGSRARGSAANDFWGEGSAALHDAIEPPPGSNVPESASTAPPSSARGSSSRATRPVRSPFARRAWGFSVRPPARRITRRLPAARGRTIVLAVVAVIVLAAAGVGMAQGGGRSTPAASRLSANAGSGTVVNTARLGTSTGHLAAPLVAAAERGHRPKTAVHHRRAARHSAHPGSRAHRRHHSRIPIRHHARHAGVRHAIQTQATAGGATTSATTTPATTSAAPPATTPAPTTPVTSSPTATSSGATTSSTPTHHSAFGQKGLLGAGHSSGDS